MVKKAERFNKLYNNEYIQNAFALNDDDVYLWSSTVIRLSNASNAKIKLNIH